MNKKSAQNVVLPVSSGRVLIVAASDGCVRPVGDISKDVPPSTQIPYSGRNI